MYTDKCIQLKVLIIVHQAQLLSTCIHLFFGVFIVKGYVYLRLIACYS